ncbi:MAG TPA: hemerythrin domain-containing protein [Myxococcaceae bacterium]|nr:hemerythrin domain-containing protein [Myxococcaceae bacterium]
MPSNPSESPVDAVARLKADHRRLQGLLNRLTSSKPRALAEREVRMRELVAALSIHLHLKETLFYPRLRARAAQADPAVLEALEAHHLLKWQLKELDGLSAAHPRFAPKVAQLGTVLKAHLAQEARRLHPLAYEHLSLEERELLGQQMAEAEAAAPTRPHPRLSDLPPLNLLQQRLVGLVDRGRDALRETRDAWTLARMLRV